MNNINKQIKLAKKSIRRSKSATPYLFPEWQYLQQCKQRKIRAKEDYAAAKLAWDNLGK
jgi:hypothetical protein